MGSHAWLSLKQLLRCQYLHFCTSKQVLLYQKKSGRESMSDSRLTDDLTMNSSPISFDTSICDSEIRPFSASSCG